MIDLRKKYDSIKSWNFLVTDKRIKNVNGLNVSEYNRIIQKKRDREILKIQKDLPLISIKLKGFIKMSLNSKGTNYFKVLIAGNSNIYYASPVHRHLDYNKSIAFPLNKDNLKLIELFNKIVKP